MARGWGSKSAVTAADMAESRPGVPPGNAPDPERLKVIRRRESILLSRTRVASDLKSAQNPRYKAQLTKALAELDAQLSAFAAD